MFKKIKRFFTARPKLEPLKPKDIYLASKLEVYRCIRKCNMSKSEAFLFGCLEDNRQRMLHGKTAVSSYC